jgi:hypothetical protein
MFIAQNNYMALNLKLMGYVTAYKKWFLITYNKYDCVLLLKSRQEVPFKHIVTATLLARAESIRKSNETAYFRSIFIY